MDVSLSVETYNNNVYRYIPAFVDDVNNDPAAPPGLNIPLLNPLEDLLRSFNFFNIDDRYESFFKLRSLSFDITHYLDDWVLKIGFKGSFQFTTNNKYEWIPELTFSLKWTPIPQFKKEFTGDNVGLKL